MPVSVRSVCYNSRLRWRHLAAALALAASIAGCSGDTTKDSGGTIAWSEPGSVTGSVAPTGATAPSGPPLGWQTSFSGDTVTVEVRDTNNYYRVERVELVGPNGITLAASEINRETNRASSDYRGYSGGPSVGVGGWGGSRGGGGAGIGLGFPLGGSASTDRAPPVATITRARVRLPDPAFYRQTVANWVIRVTTTDPGNQSSVAVIPAPKPAD